MLTAPEGTEVSKWTTAYNLLRESYSHETAIEFLALRYSENRQWLVTEFSDYVLSTSNTSKQGDQTMDNLTNAVKSKVNEHKTAKQPVGEKGPSMLSKAVDLFKNAPDKSRKAIIAEFQEKLEMSAAMASTYFYNAKKIIDKG